MNINDIEYAKENPYGLESESCFHATRKNITLSLINALITPEKNIKILDVGCGKGIITKQIQLKFPTASIDAIDFSRKAIQIAKQERTTIRFETIDVLNFKGYGYYYDIILLNNVYEHIENPPGTLIHLKNYLTEDGVFIISTPNRYHVKNIIRKLIGMEIVISKYHITEYSIGQIYDHHKYAGLKIIRMLFPKYKIEKFRVVNFLSFILIQSIVDEYLRLIRSKTRLGKLMFIISQKN